MKKKKKKSENITLSVEQFPQTSSCQSFYFPTKSTARWPHHFRFLFGSFPSLAEWKCTASAELLRTDWPATSLDAQNRCWALAAFDDDRRLQTSAAPTPPVCNHLGVVGCLRLGTITTNGVSDKQAGRTMYEGPWPNHAHLMLSWYPGVSDRFVLMCNYP